MNIVVMQKHALARLIDETREGRWSDQDLADRATLLGGYRMSKQNISRIRREPLRTIVPNQLRALALALELPLSRVVEAAIPSAGLPAKRPEDWSVESALWADPDLTPQAKRMLASMLAEARGESDGDGGDSAPTKRGEVALAADKPEATRRSGKRRPPPARPG